MMESPRGQSIPHPADGRDKCVGDPPPAEDDAEDAERGDAHG